MIKKLIAVIVVLSLFSVVIGCSNKEAVGDGKVEEISESGEIKEITFAIEPEASINLKLLEAKEKFELENKNVKINFEKIPYSAYRRAVEKKHSEGNPPDIFFVMPGDVKDFSADGLVLDLNHFLSQDNINQDKTFFKFLIDLATVNGQLSSIPVSTETYLIAYDEKRFKDAGISQPTSDWTWEEFVEAAKILQETYKEEPNFTPITMPFDGFFLENLILGNGGTLLSEDGLTAQGYLDSEISINTVQWVIDSLGKDQLAKPATLFEIANAFRNQKFNDSAMFVVTSSYNPMIPFEKGFKVSGLPSFENGEKVTIPWFYNVAISSKSEHPQEAWAFIKEFTINDTALSRELVSNSITATKSIMEESPDDMVIKHTLDEYVYSEKGSNFKNRNFYTANSTKIIPALNKLFMDAYNGSNVNVKDTLTDIAQQIEGDLKSDNYIPLR